MRSHSFDKFAGISALLAAVAILLYAISFVMIARTAPEIGAKLSALFLLLNGLLVMPPLLALYDRFQTTEPRFALWAFLLAMAGAFGATIHGGYDLANAINPPAGMTAELSSALLSLPNQVDPRGLLTFGISSIALFAYASLMGKSSEFPVALKYLGYLLAVLLAWLYLGRLIILDPTNPLLVIPVLLAGFIVNPLWYFWLGIVLQRRSNAKPQMQGNTPLGVAMKG